MTGLYLFAAFVASVIFVAVDTLLGFVGIRISFSQTILLAVMILGIPAAAVFAGACLDRYCLAGYHKHIFSFFLPLLLVCLVLEPVTIVSFLEGMIANTDHGKQASVLAALLFLLGHIVFCGTAAALSIIFFSLLFELPAHLVLGAEKSKRVQFDTVRLLLVVGGVALSTRFLADLFNSRLGTGSL